MKPGSLTQNLCTICAFVVFLGLFTREATAATQLKVDLAASKPPDASVTGTLVLVEKGKRPGLLLRFKCQDGSNPPTNVCFPIQGGAAIVQIKIGSNPAITCVTTPGAPGTCSYSFVNSQNSVTCGPAANKACIDTVHIVYNGKFPIFKQIQYSASGFTGVGGELENLANLISFTTRSVDSVQTASLELVFDISGSMDQPAVPNGATKRLKALKDSAQVLFGVLNAYALPGDKLGAVFFSNAATPNATPTSTPTCSGMPATNFEGADDPNNVNTISTAVDAQVAASSTSIGAGLQSANCGFFRETAPQNTNKQILLFSDGEQNTAPNVNVVGNSVQISDNAGANFANYPSDIRICPVTAGRQTAPGFGKQQSIADAVCGGNNAHIRSTDSTLASADLETFFGQALTTIVTSDKLEIVTDAVGTVSRGNTTIEKFLSAANDVNMTIVLSWPGSEGDRILPFQLKAPDGTIIDLANRTKLGRNASFATISFPLLQGGTEVLQKGEWQLTINGAALHNPSVSYHLLAMEDNPTVASEFAINVRDVGTGEPIPIQVKLADDGAPILNATVQAQLVGPANSQGNVLSNTPAPQASSLGTDPASTKGQAKLDALFRDPANASLFADKSLPTVTLLDHGNTGTYTGSFGGTANEGHYYFLVRVRGTSAKAGGFQRAYQIARFVRSKPDPGKTVFKLLSSASQANGTVLVKLQAIPHDSFRNFLGPGYEKDMQIKSSEGTIEDPLDDKLDGSYEITYRLASASSNPSFTIQVMGATVTTKTLLQLQGLSLWAKWLVWLLIILLLLLVIWFLLRKKHP